MNVASVKKLTRRIELRRGFYIRNEYDGKTTILSHKTGHNRRVAYNNLQIQMPIDVAIQQKHQKDRQDKEQKNVAPV